MINKHMAEVKEKKQMVRDILNSVELVEQDVEAVKDNEQAFLK